MSGSQRYRAAHKGTGRQTNDTGRRTKGIEGNRNELNAVHIQLWGSLGSVKNSEGSE